VNVRVEHGFVALVRNGEYFPAEDVRPFQHEPQALNNRLHLAVRLEVEVEGLLEEVPVLVRAASRHRDTARGGLAERGQRLHP